MTRHSGEGKYADFEIDDGIQCVTLQIGRGFGVYHYLWEPLREQDRERILDTQQEVAVTNPKFPFFSGLDPEVGQRFLVVMGGRMAYGPFDDWDAVATQLASQGYEISYSDEWAEKVSS